MDNDRSFEQLAGSVGNDLKNSTLALLKTKTDLDRWNMASTSYKEKAERNKSDVPALQDAGIARDLLEEGADPAFVKEVLKSSPEFEHIKHIQNSTDADKYLELIVNSEQYDIEIRDQGLEREGTQTISREAEL